MRRSLRPSRAGLHANHGRARSAALGPARFANPYAAVDRARTVHVAVDGDIGVVDDKAGDMEVMAAKVLGVDHSLSDP